MAEHQCENCKLRAIYYKKPQSLLGKFWRWHINWCPGWKSYMKSLDEDKKQEVIKFYNLKKFS